MSESIGESRAFHKRISNEFDTVNTRLRIILCSKLIIVHKGLLVFRIVNICHLPVQVVHNVLFLQEHVPNIYLAWTYLDRKTKMKYVVLIRLAENITLKQSFSIISGECSGQTIVTRNTICIYVQQACT